MAAVGTNSHNWPRPADVRKAPETSPRIRRSRQAKDDPFEPIAGYNRFCPLAVVLLSEKLLVTVGVSIHADFLEA